MWISMSHTSVVAYHIHAVVNQLPSNTVVGLSSAATGLIKVYHQVSLGADDTLVSKHCSKSDTAQCGISVEQYQTDNGIFTANDWEDELHSNKQQKELSVICE